MNGDAGPQVGLSWRDWLPRWEASEKLTLAGAALCVAAQLAGAQVGLLLLALLLTAAAFGWSFVKWARRLLRHFIWNLRNRMLVAFLFIAVIPLLLVVGLAGYSAKETAGQFAVYLVHSEYERRIAQLMLGAESLAQGPDDALEPAVDRIGVVHRQSFPGLRITVHAPSRTFAFPGGSEPIERTPARGTASGLVVRDGYLFGWAHVLTPRREVSLLAPLSRKFFSDLAPGLCEVGVLHFDPAAAQPFKRRPIGFYPLSSRAEEEEAVQAVPPPVNRFDFELLWATQVPIYFWDNLAQSDTALLSVHSRISAVARTLFSRRTESGLAAYMYTLGILLIVVEFISIFIGVSITTTITAAVQDLYEGTQRVMKGDFSHRIRVRGGEQIAGLSRSFNHMTENVERLLVVAKENERMQAELQIAREVQDQLFPKAPPATPGLRVDALCHAARTVSGDYYDYQELESGRLAVAIADVAGKGISAALLMASLQASLRLVIHDVQRLLAGSGGGGPFGVFPTSQLVSRINRQLHANTAPEKYASFFFAVYDPHSSLLTYTNAGHLPPVLVREGKASLLDVNGTVVGLFPETPYQESRLELKPGDVLVCYTDGVTEPENEYGEMFGEARLRELAERCAGMEGDQIIAEVIEAVKTFTGSQELQDDMTLLVVKRT
ncbi:MAG: SpoIIE family protein phosphatase [Bryobacterales bacterium]|nr:SpoIIE family protein phosphatase [Bryobacterales bacterium]